MKTKQAKWKDASNALVGNGLTTVTASHLLRCVRFSRECWSQFEQEEQISLSDPVAEFVDSWLSIFSDKETDPHASTTEEVLRAQVCVPEESASARTWRAHLY